MKTIQSLFLLIFTSFGISTFSAHAAAPAPMPAPPTIKEVASIEILSQYTKGMIEYLRTAPPYYDPRDEQKTINLNDEYAEYFEYWLSSSGPNAGYFRKKCENGKCTSYAHINDKGYCLQNAPKLMLPTESDSPYGQPFGPIEANKEFILNKLSKMYNYAINHNWPRIYDYFKAKTPEEKKEISRKMEELKIASGLIGPTQTCNMETRYTGCNLILSKLADAGNKYEIKPCI